MANRKVILLRYCKTEKGGDASLLPLGAMAAYDLTMFW